MSNFDAPERTTTAPAAGATSTAAATGATTDTAAPAKPSRRIDSLDAIRGLALCGIAFVNVPPIWELMIDPDLGPNHVHDLLNMFVQQRFFPIFSLLFGIGFGLMWASARTRVARPRVVMLRRFAFLLVLGIGHQLLQPGEALLPYAMAALVVLLPATFLPLRWLGPVTVTAGAALLGAALATGGGITTIPGLFLLGFALALYDVPRILDGNVKLNAIVLLIAAPLASLALWWQNMDQMSPGFSTSSAVAGFALAVTYVALLGFLLSTPLRSGVLAVFAPMGRMSLTNYVGATLIFVALKDTLPLLGVVDGSSASWSAAMAITAGVLVLQWMFSAAWLAFFRQGPLEWIWRQATWFGTKPAS